MQRRKKIIRAVKRIYKRRQPIKHTAVRHLGAHGSGWERKKNHRADNLRNYLAVNKAVANFAAFARNGNITDHPLYIRSNVYYNCRGEKGNFTVNTQSDIVMVRICRKKPCSVKCNKIYRHHKRKRQE